ncbi:unnamed protein product [Microthlaspi erraticum]|uniref:Uncharacterized protein n=1 Tax=Microthlaspi erraticum TaxID=1685480 RepID=A0A6D2I100_9BRAS|nr:unnamed protein product [Microthlaspi erraticum]
MQAPLPLLDDDVLIRPLHYQKDKRSGKEYIKREDEKKKKMKQEQSSSSQVRPPAAAPSELHQRPTSLWILALSASQLHRFTAAAIQALGDIVYTLQTFTETVQGFSPTSKVLVRHKAKKGEIEDATGLTQIVNQSGSASGRMDGHVAELSGA